MERASAPCRSPPWQSRRRLRGSRAPPRNTSRTDRRRSSAPASLSLARAVLRSFCASAARARSSRASPRCSASRPGSASALSRSSAALPGWFASIHRLPAAAYIRAVFGSLSPEAFAASSKPCAAAPLSPAFCDASARHTKASGSDDVGTGRRCGRSGGCDSGGEEKDQGAGSKGCSIRFATVRRIASISSGSDKRWPPPLSTFSWTSPERSARIGAERGLQRHVRVALAVKQPDGAVDRDLALEQQQSLPRFPKVARDAAPLGVGAIGEAPVGEVRRRGNADQRLHPLRTVQCQMERNPSAHRGAHDDQRSLCERVDGGERLIPPTFERALLEPAAARASAGIVEPEHAQPAPARRRRRGRPPWHPPCPTHSRAERRASEHFRGAADRQSSGRRLRDVRCRS